MGSLNLFKGGEQYHVQLHIAHEKYNDHTFDNDIALLKLSKPIKFNKYVAPIRLTNHERKDNTIVTITGYGNQNDHQSSDHLMKVNVPINKKSCLQHQIHNDHICTGWKGKIQSSKFNVNLFTFFLN